MQSPSFALFLYLASLHFLKWLKLSRYARREY